MTEQEWLECTDPREMVRFVRPTTGARKLRLAGCACVRLAWVWATDEPLSTAIESAEGFADSSVTKAALRRARQEVRKQRYDLGGTDANSRPIWTAYWLAEVLATENAYGSVIDEMHLFSTSLQFQQEAQWATVRALLRDIIGTWWKRVPMNPDWVTPTVRSLAHAAYDDRILPSGHFGLDRLAILSDALEEAGCTSVAILDHLRSPGPHARGCWAVDLLLGKE